MKIIFLQDDFPPQSFGGAGISTYELALGMKDAGHDVSVITTCRKKSDAGKSDYHGLTIWKIASDYPAKWRAYLSLYNAPVIREVEKILHEAHPDVVHASNIHFYLSYHSLKVAKRYSKAVVFTARDTMSICFGKLETKRYLETLDAHVTWRDELRQAKKRWNPFRRFCVRRYLRYADRIFAVSGALAEAFKQNGVPNVAAIRTGTDINTQDASEEKLVLFQKKYKLENKKIILFSGRLSEAKGGEKTLQAFVEIVKKEPSTVLLVAGKIDEYADEMKREAEKLGIGGRLIFTGWIERDDIRVATALADIVLMPSIYLDPFPRAVIEAMASGKPVIGTRYGGTPEIVENGVTGYIVNPLHPEEIAEKSLDLLKNPGKAKRFGEVGYERVKSQFSLQSNVQEYVAAYEALLGEQK